VLLYYLGTGGKAYTASLVLQTIVQAVKDVEYLFVKFGVYTDAIVPHFKLMIDTYQAVINIDHRIGTRSAKLDPIGNQILKQLNDAAPVGSM
jgi:ACT domain-containing protein